MDPDQIEFTSKTTWKPLTDLKKTEIVRLYDALSQPKTKINRSTRTNNNIFSYICRNTYFFVFMSP